MYTNDNTRTKQDKQDAKTLSFGWVSERVKS